MTKIRVVLMICASLALGSPALAETITLSQSAYSAGVGGEFTVGFGINGQFSGNAYSTAKGTGTASTFQTFCIEYNEEFNPGGTYNAVLNPDGAIAGGIDGGNPDPVSAGTGWLYSHFAAGNLLLYNYTGTTAERIASAGALQQAIWMLEDEVTPWDPTNIFIHLLLTQAPGLNTMTLAKGGSAAVYGVSAINVTYTSGALSQDQLYAGGTPGQQCDACGYVPDGGMTMSLLGMALTGMGFALRRRK